jgi:hypothetical protein
MQDQMTVTEENNVVMMQSVLVAVTTRWQDSKLAVIADISMARIAHAQ